MSTNTDRLRRFVAGDQQPATGPVQAIWRGVVIAESDRTVVVEGNHYFPPEDVKSEHLESISEHTVCPWKGTASYYDVVVDGERNRGAAWYYPKPSRAAAQIKDHVAFWHGIKVSRARDPKAENGTA
jgi:uncharacterized protein (DUF427 family)